MSSPSQGFFGYGKDAQYDAFNMVKSDSLLSKYKEIASGAFDVDANGIVRVANLAEEKGGFYLLRWTTEEGEGVNHYVCNIGEGWTYEKYKACMQKAGFYDEFEGF